MIMIHPERTRDMHLGFPHHPAEFTEYGLFKSIQTTWTSLFSRKSAQCNNHLG